MLPQLRRIEQRYADRVTVLGIHSPKFPAEAATEALADAVARLDVRHPVANDRTHAIWQAYGVRAWPTLIFIDPSGRVIGRHEGEIDAGRLSQLIDALLAEFPPAPAGAPAWEHPPAAAPRDARSLCFPGRAVPLPDGGHAVSDTGNHRVLLLDRHGRVARVCGGPGEGMADGPAGQARFRLPQGLVPHGQELLVADTGNHALRAVHLASGAVRTLAGDGRQGALWSSPWGITLLGDRVLIAMAGAHQVAVWDIGAGRGSVLAGSGHEALRDGPLSQCAFAQPSGLVPAPDGRTLYVADSETSAVRALDLLEGTVRTLVGQGLFTFGDEDGTADSVRLQHPLDLAWLGELLYVADSYNHRIKTLDPRTRYCGRLAGSGRAGDADGRGDAAAFSEPGGISADANRLLVTDTNNHALRWVDPESGATMRPALHLPRGCDEP